MKVTCHFTASRPTRNEPCEIRKDWKLYDDIGMKMMLLLLRNGIMYMDQARMTMRHGLVERGLPCSPIPTCLWGRMSAIGGNGSTHFQRPRDTGRRANIPRSMSSHSGELGSMFAHGGHGNVLRGRSLVKKRKGGVCGWFAVLYNTDQWPVLRLLSGFMGYSHPPRR
jgi:hypothetical protein